MKKSKRFASLSVISLEEGQQIGTVKGLIVDPANKKVAALIIEQKGWFKEQRFIPYHKVHSVGSDAITIEKNTCVEKASNLSEIVRLLKDKVGVIGSKIVAENGTVLGYVDEFYVDLETGAIAGLEFSGNLLNSVIKGRAFLDIAHVRTLGKDVTIITDEGLENIFKLEGGLQETVKNIRESTGQLWDTTVQKTKELSTSINKKVKKDKKTDPKPDDQASNFHDDLTRNQDKSAAPEEPSSQEQPADKKDATKEPLEETVITPSEDNDRKDAPPPA
ncbi:PRC-barrel domain-containing protein [Pelotomaculum isophthalicicum JI]|uniref:PRC-barrel domain-containing protein n=1 Tax=Pelotomaculum isophthalicicum JI TaxID=947010 RepID=A0A9X4JSY0_9FIRM|nr:PRC-barrel domain-containing protein [Pelotomaculum isophthalicicum]MDF9407719.1 PRC-barrel domain-containing protein [Pelotomaculum isophthalicicum JI]